MTNQVSEIVAEVKRALKHVPAAPDWLAGEFGQDSAGGQGHM